MLSGRALRRHLETLGVTSQKIVRKRETGHYVAEFFVPQMAVAILPADEWAERILEVLPDAQIINTHDTIAAWRPSQPVIFATVIFQLAERMQLKRSILGQASL
jgi:hypothetical protein